MLLRRGDAVLSASQPMDIGLQAVGRQFSTPQDYGLSPETQG
jgi:hypothetical protein